MSEDIFFSKYNLPKLDFELHSWKECDLDAFKEKTKYLRKLSRKAGTSSTLFTESYNRLYQRTIQNSFVVQDIKNARDVRALSFLLAYGDKVSKKVPLSYELFEHLLSIRNPMSKLTLMQFIRAFLIHFDDLSGGNKSSLEIICKFLRHQLNMQPKDKANDLSIYAKYSDVIFSLNAPLNLINIAKKNKQDLDTVAQEIRVFTEGVLFHKTQQVYYLDTLQNIPVGENHTVLSELSKENVADVRYNGEYLLGHETLKILIDRTESSGGKISPYWQNVILTIAGDPRIPKSHPQYQKWWALLGEKRIRLVQNWLSGLDLKIFLKILEQSARDKGDSDMERMFMPRKIFMEGLLQQELIQGSRLFLTKDAENYLKRYYTKEQLPSYARVNAHASVIYLYLGAANLHMVEGTHSFSVRVMDRLPERAYINNYNYRDYDSHNLGAGLKRLYYNEFGTFDGMLETSHDVHLNWQNKLITLLEIYGVDLDISTLLPKSRVREYKSKFGA